MMLCDIAKNKAKNHIAWGSHSMMLCEKMLLEKKPLFIKGFLAHSMLS